jgi:serine/threonine-protein kinase HipA
MAFKMNGKDDKLKLRDFLTLARTIELPVERAERIVRHMASSLHKAARELGLPTFVARWEERHKTTARDSVRRIVRERTQALLQ